MKKLKPALLLAVFVAGAVNCEKEAKPDDTLKQFFDALARNYFESIDKITTPESAKAIADFKTISQQGDKPAEERLQNAHKLAYSPAEIKGDSVFINVTSPKNPKSMIYTLVKKNGKWIIDLSAMSMKSMVEKQ